MKLNEYQRISRRTMPSVYDHTAKTNYGLGIMGEAGEVGDLIKKEVFHGHEEDREKVKKELGDVLHYLSGLADMYGWSLEEVASANIEKLMKRYPNGFSEEDSKQRVDVGGEL